jgi:hypothetical protein
MGGVIASSIGTWPCVIYRSTAFDLKWLKQLQAHVRKRFTHEAFGPARCSIWDPCTLFVHGIGAWSLVTSATTRSTQLITIGRIKRPMHEHAVTWEIECARKESTAVLSFAAWLAADPHVIRLSDVSVEVGAIQSAELVDTAPRKLLCTRQLCEIAKRRAGRDILAIGTRDGRAITIEQYLNFEP